MAKSFYSNNLAICLLSTLFMTFQCLTGYSLEGTFDFFLFVCDDIITYLNICEVLHG